MGSLDPMNNQLQTRFSLEQTQVYSLSRKLQSRENKEQLMETARKFEGIFFKQLLDAMDKSVDRSGLFNGGSGEEMFRGMLYDKISEINSIRPGGSGYGLAEAIYKQLESQLPKEPKQVVDQSIKEKGG